LQARLLSTGDPIAFMLMPFLGAEGGIAYVDLYFSRISLVQRARAGTILNDKQAEHIFAVSLRTCAWCSIGAFSFFDMLNLLR